uniref:Uncharacterized protein n=1 Tax=Meloidogyne hapla TaxID=6305 RepID=A0A1I8AY82_MELHA
MKFKIYLKYFLIKIIFIIILIKLTLQNDIKGKSIINAEKHQKSFNFVGKIEPRIISYVDREGRLYNIKVTFYPISGEEFAKNLSLETEHEFSFNFLFNRSLLKNPKENLKEKLKRLKTNIFKKFSKDERKLYNLNGIEFEGIKRILIEINIPINGNDNHIKRSWQIENPNLNKSFTFFVGAFSDNIYLRAKIHLFNEKKFDPFFNDEDNILIKSNNGNDIFEKFKFKDVKINNNDENNLNIFPNWKEKYSKWFNILLQERSKRTTILLNIPINKVLFNYNKNDIIEENNKLINSNKIILSIEKEKDQIKSKFDEGESSKANEEIQEDLAIKKESLHEEINQIEVIKIFI